MRHTLVRGIIVPTRYLWLALILIYPACFSQAAPYSQTTTTKTAAQQITTPVDINTYISPCHNAALKNLPSHIVLGYGSGETVSEAKNNARQDIAETLGAKIKTTAKGISKKNGTQNSRSYTENFEISATTELTQATQDCLDQNDPSGIIHVALRIDQRPPLSILSEKILRRWNGATSKTIHWRGPQALIRSIAVKELENKLTINPVNENARPLNINLYRKNDRWYLEVDTEQVVIPDNMLSSLLNWDSNDDSPVYIDIVKYSGSTPQDKTSSRFTEGDEFKFHITQTQEEPVYLTPFNIYPDGRVAQLTDSMEITEYATIPADGIFSASLIEPGKRVNDIYLFIITDSAIENLQFQKLRANSGITSNDESYQLDTFIKWLDTLDMMALQMKQAAVLPR